MTQIICDSSNFLERTGESGCHNNDGREELARRLPPATVRKDSTEISERDSHTSTLPLWRACCASLDNFTFRCNPNSQTRCAQRLVELGSSAYLVKPG